jgi:hypothetical protein
MVCRAVHAAKLYAKIPRLFLLVLIHGVLVACVPPSVDAWMGGELCAQMVCRAVHAAKLYAKIPRLFLLVLIHGVVDVKSVLGADADAMHVCTYENSDCDDTSHAFPLHACDHRPNITTRTQ